MLNGPQLSSEIRAAIAAAVASPNPATVHVDVWDAIATAIVLHIQTNAVVLQANDSSGDTEANGTVI